MRKINKKEVVFSEEFPEKFIQDSHFLLTYELHFLVNVIRENLPKLISKEMLAYFDSLPYFANREVKASFGLFFVKNLYVVVEEDDGKGNQRFNVNKKLAEFVERNLKAIIDESIENDVLLYFQTSLTNLYGCLSVDQFLTVWHQYNKIDVSEKKVIEICQHFALQKHPFRYERNYIVHEVLCAEELDEMLGYVSHKPYYLPTAKEVGLYISGIIERSSEAYIRMADYLNNHPGGLDQANLDGLIENVAYALKFNADRENILKIFELMNYDFEGEQMDKSLDEILSFSMKNTRKWINRGYTDEEYFTIIPIFLSKGQNPHLKNYNHHRI